MSSSLSRRHVICTSHPPMSNQPSVTAVGFSMTDRRFPSWKYSKDSPTVPWWLITSFGSPMATVVASSMGVTSLPSF
jgi:hypothetical protein